MPPGTTHAARRPYRDRPCRRASADTPPGRIASSSACPAAACSPAAAAALRACCLLRHQGQCRRIAATGSRSQASPRPRPGRFAPSGHRQKSQRHQDCTRSFWSSSPLLEPCFAFSAGIAGRLPIRRDATAIPGRPVARWQGAEQRKHAAAPNDRTRGAGRATLDDTPCAGPSATGLLQSKPLESARWASQSGSSWPSALSCVPPPRSPATGDHERPVTPAWKAREAALARSAAIVVLNDWCSASVAAKKWPGTARSIGLPPTSHPRRHAGRWAQPRTRHRYRDIAPGIAGDLVSTSLAVILNLYFLLPGSQSRGADPLASAARPSGG